MQVFCKKNTSPAMLLPEAYYFRSCLGVRKALTIKNTAACGLKLIPRRFSLFDGLLHLLS